MAPLGWLWNASRVPSTYSVMGMGYVDSGGGPAGSHAGHGDHADHGWEGPPPQPGDVSVADLTGPRGGTPDVAVTLTARRQRFTLASGERVGGYTINGRSPGPEIRARQGDLVQVTLVNAGVPDGITLHWHGVDVPNAEDGVAGVTQDAVPSGGRHVYRFVAEDAGTYWYHSHQVSHEQVRGGLFGTLVVAPKGGAQAEAADVVAAVHSYGGRRTISGRTGLTAVPTPAGRPARVRLVNTDNGPLRAWVTGGSFRVLAVDGRDVHGPTEVRDRLLVVAAGGRLDLELTAPTDGSAARLDVGGGTALLVGPAGSRRAEAPAPRQPLDLLGYGSPSALPFDPDRADRRFEFRIGRRPGFVDGRPGFWWTVNGHLFPDLPMFVVSKGDVVRMTISNKSGDVHPMHLHGHHAVVLSRNGVAATGSPWWVDSLEVEAGETY
ncbi:MAG TPA: multicopper oxidase family protein, partial [Candidatus Eisenbacteria bacterium]|nr:multicopper oxidase family protein [Candidatus Eisenbacteria bacterium]